MRHHAFPDGITRDGLLGWFRANRARTRQIFDIAVESVQTSCGWGVPLMELERPRATLVKYHAQADPAKWAAKTAARTRSIDGLPTRPTDRYIAGDPGTIPA